MNEILMAERATDKVIIDSKALCKKLLKAESEQEVQDIIDNTPAMRNTNNWHAVDGRDTNRNIVSNQATTGGKAATELMTNMVDAILMKEAYKRGIDPKSKADNVPKTMYEAVDTLVENLYGGKLIKADKVWLREYSCKNLAIGLTKSESSGNKPCLTFADNGEGQHAEVFKDTFLSLSARNKTDIPFVQGKFNMGGSGVLNFCGNKWFKLIVSRRYDESGEWGWTLIRKRPNVPIPIADYFAVNKKISTFAMDRLFPLHKRGGDNFEDFSLETGTIIKLYDFALGGRFDSRHAREAFIENLVETILPFRIYDFRDKPYAKKKDRLRAEGIVTRPFYGMEYLLLNTHAEDTESEEDTTPDSETKSETVSKIDDPKLGTIRITAIPLKVGKPEWLQKERSRNRVFHAVNGQVQFKQTRGFLTNCNYSHLKDRVVIIVDASDLTPDAHNAIWKGDREHIMENEPGQYYKSVVKEALQKSEELKKLNTKFGNARTEQEYQKETVDILQKLADEDKNLLNMLNGTNPKINRPNITKSNNDSEYKGKYSPTSLELEKRFRDKIIEIPINKSRLIIAQTDAVNDYFSRPDNRGDLYISDDEVEKYFRITSSLKNGRLIVSFKPDRDSGLYPGQQFSFEIGLKDPAMPMAVAEPVTILVTEESEKPKASQKKKDEPQKEIQKPTKGLPEYTLLTKDGQDIPELGQKSKKWPHDFDEYDGGITTGSGEDVIYEINYDNAFYKQYLDKKKYAGKRKMLAQKYILGMRLLMFSFEHAIRDDPRYKDETDDDFKENKEDFQKMAAKGIAKIVPALAEAFPKISGIPTDDDDDE